MPIHCEIVSQDRIVYQGDVDMVTLPGSAGALGVLPNHAPVLMTLQFGIIRLNVDGETHYFTVAGGVAEVQPDQVTVLADAAENIEEINIQRAEAARQRADAMLKEGTGHDPDTYLQLQAALRRSNLRLGAIQRYRQRRNS